MAPKVVGVPKEIKDDEYRVGLTPSAAGDYILTGIRVIIQTEAGNGSGFLDEEYVNVGCEIVPSAQDVYRHADMIIKVKEPLPAEYDYIRPNQLVFTFFHFAANEELTKAMIKSRATCIAYETIRLNDDTLPILMPMSEIAGKLAAEIGAQYLQRNYGGRGVLMAGAAGVKPAKVLVLGCGIAGKNAARIAAGMGADVIITDVCINRLRLAAEVLPANVRTLYSTDVNLIKELPDTHVVIGAILVTGAKTPQIIKRRHLRLLKPGSVVIDIAVDQGGCIETCRPTTHKNATYVEEGVIHYCVANIPGVVPYTSTVSLGNATLKYGLELAAKGVARTCKMFPEVLRGVDVSNGKVYQPGVAYAFGLPLSDRQEILDMQ